MNPWWSQQEWFCRCQTRPDGTRDPVVHVHRQEPPHACARCPTCRRYQPAIPETEAIRILIGPEMTNAQAATILLGPPDKLSV